MAGFFNDADIEQSRFQDSAERHENSLKLSFWYSSKTARILCLEMGEDVDLPQNYGLTLFLTRSKSRTFEGAWKTDYIFCYFWDQTAYLKTRFS